MTKPTKSAETSTPFLFELPNSVRCLILKRGRLLRSGEKISVERLPELPDVNRTAWLRAVSYTANGVGSPWDKAHELSFKVKRDLGVALPYVEPEFNNGQSGLFHDLMMRLVRQTDRLPEDRSQAACDMFEKSNLIPDPMRELRAVFPNVNMLTGLNIQGLHPSKNNPSHDFEAEFSEPDHSKPNSTQEQTDKTFGMQKQSRFFFPLIHSLPTWLSLAASTKRMFEIEVVQVYRCSEIRAQYPGLESDCLPALSEEESQLIFKSLLELPMSMRLRRLLQVQ